MLFIFHTKALLYELLINTGVGLTIGVIIGATGVGGGAIMTPILLFGYGLPIGVAVGTDLVFACLTKIAALGGYASRRSVDWRVVLWLSCGSIPATVLTLSLWPSYSHDIEVVATQLLGLVLFGTAIAYLLRPWLQRRTSKLLDSNTTAQHFSPTSLTTWKLVATGVGVGTIVALTSVGAGVIGTVALFIIAPLLGTTRLIGSEIAHAVVLTAIAGLGHAWMANVDWTLALSLAAGSIPGALLGALLAHHQLNCILRYLLIGAVSISGLTLALGR